VRLYFKGLRLAYKMIKWKKEAKRKHPNLMIESKQWSVLYSLSKYVNNKQYDIRYLLQAYRKNLQ